MQTIDNTASVDTTGTVKLDNGWSVTPIHGRVYVHKPFTGDSPDNLGEPAGVFDSIETALEWAASGGTSNPATGIRFRPS